MSELIVDTFAGGGGASCGIEMALDRSPDIAINHDPMALAMHQANHPASRHLSKNIWQVDPIEAVGNRPVGLLWASPDCKHFSKAKGGKPIKRNIRDLAWAVVLWAKRARPRVIILENVEEFLGWGPLILRDGKFYPDPERAGETFDRWVSEFRRLGYRLEHRKLRACDYGAPTVRRRLFVIARRDGRPIVWPEPTHGEPASEAVKTGRLKPWRTAAEIIDWSRPCPSIFMDRAEATAYRMATGIRINRPLAEATMARIARGVKRYVLDAERPFIVGLAHGDSGGRREYGLDEPLTTVDAGGNNHALVTPFVSYGQQGGMNRAAGRPMHTITASPKDTNALVAPYLVPRYQERPGQAPRTRSVELPTATVVPGGNEGVLAAAYLSRQFSGSTGSPATAPAGTITAGGAGKTDVVAAFLAQHNGGMVGHKVDKPVSTIVQRGTTQALVAAHMLNLKGGDRRDGVAQEPLHTITAGGDHAALVASFMIKYYGSAIGAHLTEPAHTDTVKPRIGLVTVDIAGEPYVIVDIGMRMLTPRERFLAQGFPPTYQIEADADGNPITATDQGRLCGNSVCPPLAAALVDANCPDLAADAGSEAAA